MSRFGDVAIGILLGATGVFGLGYLLERREAQDALSTEYGELPEDEIEGVEIIAEEEEGSMDDELEDVEVDIENIDALQQSR